jgi:hypothetical protein
MGQAFKAIGAVLAVGLAVTVGASQDDGVAREAAFDSLEWAADVIRDASGNNAITSRADIKIALQDLGGKEKALVAIFFRFIDHRDAAPGARVTEPDISRTVAYAQRHLIDRYDVNDDGRINSDEWSSMSRIGKLAISIAADRTGDQQQQQQFDMETDPSDFE